MHWHTNNCYHIWKPNIYYICGALAGTTHMMHIYDTDQ